MSNPKESIRIENVIASTTIDQELDLAQINNDLPDADYNPDQFPGIVYRMTNPKATSLIFRSGKVVCNGAQSVAAVEEAINTAINMLANLGIPIGDPPEPAIQNVVASGSIGHPLNLNAVAIGLGLESVEYEPEQFPGLIYQLDEPEVVVILFSSGKAIIAGGTEKNDAERAIEAVRERLRDLELLDA